MKISKPTAWAFATLLAASLIGCGTKEEEPKILYQIKTKNWEVRAEEKNGRKAVEGNKDGYRIRVEERKDGGYDVEVDIPKNYGGKK